MPGYCGPFIASSPHLEKQAFDVQRSDYCFLGAEAVNGLQHSDIATSTLDAILIGQALFDKRIVESVAENVTTFHNNYIFCRFLAGAT